MKSNTRRILLSLSTSINSYNQQYDDVSLTLRIYSGV